MIKITLPWPNSRLLPNRKNGLHWATTHKIKQEAIKTAFYATKESMSGNNKHIDSTQKSLKIVFYGPDRRKRDLDNLLAAMKPSIDGMAKALGVDDSIFRPITLDMVYDPKKIGIVEISIDEGNK